MPILLQNCVNLTVTNKRLRVRDVTELERQNRGLVELSMILEAATVPHYLASGTLLGAVRDQNFIPWDWDVQFYFRLEDVCQRYDELIDLMRASGFRPIKTDDSALHWKIIVAKYDTIYEMTAWVLKGKLRVRRDWKMAADFFNNPDQINFLGRKYICMTPAEDYLVHSYGHDWRIPKRTDDKNEYLAPAYFRKSRLRRMIEGRIHRAGSAVKGFLLRAVAFR